MLAAVLGLWFGCGGVLPGAAVPASAGAVVVADSSTPQVSKVPVKAEPDGSAVSLDVSVYSPGDGARHPAVLLAHGFGGSKDDLAARAQNLAGQGYVALTYSARGFGASGGRVHLDSPDYEVADARALIDVLAGRSDVQLDAAGDPRVGVIGASYGGALALMSAGTDPRVDAVAASITWNDLSTALFPQAAQGSTRPGPFAQLWASSLYSGVMQQKPSASSTGARPTAAPTASPSPSPSTSAGPSQPVTDPMCGRFDPTVCRLFLPAANTGKSSAALTDLLRRNSPARTNAQIKAPTLLIQGQSDSLFGLGQADATWRQLTAAGTPVAMRWTDGGHDSPSLTADDDEAAIDSWLQRYLTDSGRSASGAQTGSSAQALPVPAFTYAGVRPRGGQAPPLFTLPTYPTLSGSSRTTLDLQRPAPQRVLSPPGARPAATLAVPGVGDALGSAAAYRLAALPGASAVFDTAAPAQSLQVVGAPQLTMRVTSSTTDATFYVSLWQVTGGAATLVHRLSAPVQIATTPGQPAQVTLTLPPGVWSMPAGSTWRVLVTSTDTASTTPLDAREYTVQSVGGLVLPTVTGAQQAGTGGSVDVESWALVAALAALALLIGAVVVWRRRRERADEARVVQSRAADSDVDASEAGDDTADVVLAVDHLVKTYRDGHRAVDDVSFEARRGQVVGLLGPNGAGKTTTLRMVMGLIQPSHGEVRVQGRVVRPGSAVLADVGALVEGPGFLPHLSGRANLEAYWSATGRPRDDAHLDEALDIAALGDAVERPVRSYSQGMRQRLGIAQAMLGLPDVLILDEPTNGLDPPQIAAMRPVLRAYAATGRTVIVSSHLLAEVEMTSTHVVVMDRGHVIVTGSVEELTAGADGHTRRRLEEVFLGVLSESHGDTRTGEAGEGMDVDAVVERLRQVRSR